jgi:hypothetical protein
MAEGKEGSVEAGELGCFVESANIYVKKSLSDGPTSNIAKNILVLNPKLHLILLG